MTATEELRKLLDEHGVEWMDDSYAQLWCTVWHGSDGKQWRMTENRSGMLTELKAWQTTPEQAIAATLGGDDKSRWHELFGTPERAARTIVDKELGYKLMKCENYHALLEWLRGDTE